MSLSQLRPPLAFGEILAGAFALYRRQSPAFVRTSVLVCSPVLPARALASSPGNSPIAMLAVIALLPAYIFATAISAGTITRLASNACVAQLADSAAALRRALDLGVTPEPAAVPAF